MINVVNPAHEKTNEDKHMKAVHEINNITEKPDSGNVHDDIIDLKHLYILVPKEPKSNNKETNDNKFNNTLNEVTFNANEEIEDVDIIADVKHTRQIHAPVEDNKTVDLFDKTNRNGTDDNMENYRYVFYVFFLTKVHNPSVIKMENFWNKPAGCNKELLVLNEHDVIPMFTV